MRIVKRESERRQRDKDKPGGPLIGSNVFDHIAELQSSDELNEYLSTTYTSGSRIGSYSEDDALISDDEICLSSSITSSNKMLFKPNARVESALKNISIDRNAVRSNNIALPSDRFQINHSNRIHDELPVNDSAQSMMTVSKQQLTDMANQYKRNVPRKKKRHNTAPNSVHNDIFNDYLATRNASKQVNLVSESRKLRIKLNNLFRLIIVLEMIWTWKSPFVRICRIFRVAHRILCGRHLDRAMTIIGQNNSQD